MHYATGACTAGHCQCTDFPTTDAGASDDSSAEADAEAEVEADAVVDAEAEADAGREPVSGTWVAIEPGTFEMGSPAMEPGHTSQETQHSVTLTRRFEILSTEVTQAQFKERVGYNPSSFAACGIDCPVEMVTWHEAAAYCNALSACAGLESCYACSGTGADVRCYASGSYPDPYECPGYRLPTEAEWEYAARAGSAKATYNGTCDNAHLGCEQPNPVLDSIAWFCGNGGETTHPVGMRAPNPWGLYDMLGNVFEWCNDYWDGSDYPAGAATDPRGRAVGRFRVSRGGTWIYGATLARAAQRERGFPEGRSDSTGFRPARTLP